MSHVYYPTDQIAKDAIIACGKRLYGRGLVAGSDGNLSVRVSPRDFWITPTGVSKGTLWEGMLLKVTLEGKVIKGDYRPTSEMAMHIALYRSNPDIRAILHAHPPVSTAFAAAGMPLDKPVLQEAVVQLGVVPVVPYALPGSQELAETVALHAQGHRGLLLEYHGALTWGKDMSQALHRLETMEQYATVLLHLKTLGSDRVMPPALVSDLEELRHKLGL